MSINAFSRCLVAEVEIAGSIELELRALDWLYLTVAPEQRLCTRAPARVRGLERSPLVHGTEHFELRAQLPVVDARVPL